MAYIGRRFRRHRLRTPGKLPPAAIVAICLGAAILITLIVGNVLHYTLDEDMLKKLTSGTKAPESPEPPPERTVPAVQAYPFALGDPIKSLTGNGEITPSALSVSLNTPEGELLYTSPVAVYQGLQVTDSIPLADKMTELRTAVPYICGVFYPQALNQESDDLFYAVAAQEAALLREFAHAGAAEILLVGLPLDAEHLGNTLTYLELVSTSLGNTYLGIGVPLSDAASEQGWSLLPTLLDRVSYLALDLQAETASAETALTNANYYLVEHQMRLLLASDQTDLINLVQSYLTDFQILTAPPKPDPEPDPTPDPTPDPMPDPVG